jgi:putative tryptophan/tyrosine transport system substrate-binding protein
VLRANTSREIDAAFSTFGQERPDPLFVTPDGFFTSQRVQLSNLTARERIPASYATREIVDAGGLMSYGTNLAEAFRQDGIYVGGILNGTNPSDLPVLQSTRFEFVINLQTARLLGIEVPPTLVAIADEVIE